MHNYLSASETAQVRRLQIFICEPPKLKVLQILLIKSVSVLHKKRDCREALHTIHYLINSIAVLIEVERRQWYPKKDRFHQPCPLLFLPHIISLKLRRQIYFFIFNLLNHIS